MATNRMMNIRKLLGALGLWLVVGFSTAQEDDPISSLLLSLDSTMEYSFEAIFNQEGLSSTLSASSSYLATLSAALLTLSNVRQDKVWEKRFLCDEIIKVEGLRGYLLGLKQPVADAGVYAELKLVGSMLNANSTALAFFTKEWKYSCSPDPSLELLKEKVKSKLDAEKYK